MTAVRRCAAGSDGAEKDDDSDGAVDSRDWMEEE